jgi:hypothetical protein
MRTEAPEPFDCKAMWLVALHITIWLRLADLGSELAWVFSDVLQRTQPLKKVLVLLPGWNRLDR